MLIDRGANLHDVGRDGLTPLAWAIRCSDWRPGAEGLEAAPVTHRDSNAIRATGALDAQEARLLPGQLLHPIGNLTVTGIVLGRPARGENDGIIRWGGCLCADAHETGSLENGGPMTGSRLG